MSLLKIVNWLSLLFAGLLVTTSLMFAYVLLVPLDVVTDWKIHVDPKTYRPGDEITLHVSYRKLKDVSGISHYYLECQTPRHTLVRYPISQTEGNRPRGQGEVDVPLKLPGELPGLPTECRIAVSADYTIYTFRKFVENNDSNYFTVSDKE